MEGQPRGRKLRVTLDRVQILDTKEPFFKPFGEIRLRARVSTPNNGGIVSETSAPAEGSFSVYGRGERSLVELGLPIFEGYVEDHLEVELEAIEVDQLSCPDAYQTYRRIHRGAERLAGLFGPDDEILDAEEMTDWRVWYRIEEV
jgi:hypothetical protein